MSFSTFWSHVLLNPSICLPKIQLVTPYVISNDSNSSTSSQSSVGSPEQEDNNVACSEVEINAPKKLLQRIRYSKEEYKCGQCPYSCTTEKAFIHHARFCGMQESSQSLVSCPICGKDRRNEEMLNLHMRKHKQDKYFCCDICKFKTLQLKKLIQHRRMHTGEKPHLCPFCSYRSSRRDNLRSHVRRVHKKQNLNCDTFTPRNMVLSARKITN